MTKFANLSEKAVSTNDELSVIYCNYMYALKMFDH